jgi:hypothetical protein
MRLTLSIVLFTACSTTGEDARHGERAPGAEVEMRTEPTTGSEPAAAVSPEPPAPAHDENEPRWHDALTEIAQTYARWGRVDDELRWAPGLCRMQMPGRARFSASDDEGTHGGRKLYSVFALDPQAYGAMPSAGGLHGERSIVAGPPAVDPDAERARRARGVRALADVVQVLVKESFRPEETPRQGDGSTWGRRLSPATRGGRTYHAGEPLGLYVMMRTRDAGTPGTDAGWVYGTIAPDGTITASGRVRSCMSCHVDAPHDRWFGLPSYDVYVPE